MKNITLSLAFLYALSGFAQEEYINTDFGTDGYLCLGGDQPAFVMGDIIKVGNDFYGLTSHAYYNLVKFNSSGQIDSEFGDNGILDTGLSSGSGQLYDMTNAFIKQTADNNLLLIADPDFIPDTSTSFMVKLDLDGNPVTSFGDNGYVHPFIEYSVEIESVDITDTEIILVGQNTTYFGEPENFIVVAKYDLDGNLITAFGEGGVMRYDIQSDAFIYASQYHQGADAVYVLLFDDGEILSSILKFDLAMEDLDSSFGSGGFFPLENSINADYTLNNAFYVDAGQNLYIAGSEQLEDATGQNVFVKKFNSALEPDTTFGNNGVAQHNVGTNLSDEKIGSFNITEDRITLVGYTFEFEGLLDYERIFIMKMDTNGNLVEGFGENGVVMNNLFSTDNMPYKTIEEDGVFTIATFSQACRDMNSPTVIQMIAQEELSVNNFDNAAVTFFPNPFKDTISFDNASGITGIELYDISGKLLSIFNKPEDTLNLSYLQEGVYLLKITTDAGISTQKIVKQ